MVKLYIKCGMEILPERFQCLGSLSLSHSGRRSSDSFGLIPAGFIKDSIKRF